MGSGVSGRWRDMAALVCYVYVRGWWVGCHVQVLLQLYVAFEDIVVAKRLCNRGGIQKQHESGAQKGLPNGPQVYKARLLRLKVHSAGHKRIGGAYAPTSAVSHYCSR